MDRKEETFTIAVICRANVARSYLAEEFLRAALARHLVATKFRVFSRGTQVFGVESVPAEVTEIVTRLGAKGGNHSPTKVSSEDLNHSDLVLVAEKGMEEILVDMAPASANRTFSLIEFGRLVSDPMVQAVLPENVIAKNSSAPERLRQHVATLSNYRGYLTLSDEPEDIEDPAGKHIDALYATAKIVEKWTGVVADWCARP